MLNLQPLSFDIDNYESVTVRKRRMHIEKIIESLGLQQHPLENGYSKEIFRSQLYVDYPSSDGEKRNFCAGIYYLLTGKDYSPWHRLKNSEELWMFHSGSTMNIYMISVDGDYSIRKLGSKLATRDPLTEYEVHIPVNTWFACEVVDKTSYCLATVTIAPSQEKEDFEIKTVEELSALFPQCSEAIQKFGLKTISIEEGVKSSKSTDDSSDEISDKGGDEVDKLSEHEGASCRSDDTSGNVSNDNDECSKGTSESEDSEALSDLSNLGLSDCKGKNSIQVTDGKSFPKIDTYTQFRTGVICQDENLKLTGTSSKLPLIINGDR